MARRRISKAFMMHERAVKMMKIKIIVLYTHSSSSHPSEKHAFSPRNIVQLLIPSESRMQGLENIVVRWLGVVSIDSCFRKS